ncbi:MAG: hypothetical protein ACC635_01745, partial [Acidiferrobacterales bacterium]
ALLPLTARYLPSVNLPELFASNEQVMAIVNYGSELDFDIPGNLVSVNVPLQQLSAQSIAEVWLSDSEVKSATSNGIHYSFNSSLLFGHVVADIPGIQNLEQEVEEKYQRISKFTKEKNYPHIIRVWNYVPDINDEPGGMENYKSFSLGRSNAFEDQKIDMVRELPAASALGIKNGKLIIYFIASKIPGSQVENPRQINAYHYPPKYGPKSPSFARANIMTSKDGYINYISGTASIVGHETLHTGDVEGQLRETITNINTVLEMATRKEYKKNNLLSENDLLKVYIRDGKDFSLVQNFLEKETSVKKENIMYLETDICRNDLLLEIEAVSLALKD